MEDCSKENKVITRPPAKVPTHLIFVVSSIFHYLGPAFAVVLFGYVSVLGVAWLRIATAATIFAIWRKPLPAILEMTRRNELLALAALGATFAAMNSCFYLAISKIPLSTVGAIEFLAPVGLAAVGVRGLRNFVAFSAAVGGAYLLSEIQLPQQPLALVFAFANCVLFGCYISLGHRFSQQGSSAGIDRVGFSMILALAFITPVGIVGASVSFFQPVLIGAGVGLGVCSSVIPYVLDQIAMSRLSRASFALLTSILPVMATIIGAVVLKQLPTLEQGLGISFIVAGVAVHQPSDHFGKGARKDPSWN